MQTGRGGMGSHKHGTHGRAPRSPGYKQTKTRESNALAEEERAKKPKPKMYTSIADVLRKK
jgi:hypothetical protein